jgi:TRAP-type C4-dicarboxylate transport system substrate-binding protein
MKSKYLVVLAITLVLIVALILPACAQPAPAPKPAPTPAPTPAPAPKDPVKFKFSYTMPKGASVGAAYEFFGPEFEKRTQGRYKIETYPGSTLIPVPAALDSVKKDVAQIVMTSVGTFPKDFALSNVMTIPTLGFAGKNADDIVQACKAAWEFVDTTAEAKAEFKDVQLVWTQVLDPYNLVSRKKEIHGPSDFSGMKVGGPSAGGRDMVQAAGGAGVNFAPPESYQNLEKGVVDAAFLTLAQVEDYKLFEICDYYYRMDFGGGVHIILMNKDAWAKIPPADQKIFLETWPDAGKVGAQNSLVQVEKGIKSVTAAGKKIYDPTADERVAWEKSAQVAIDKWAADAQALKIAPAVTDSTLAKWKQIRAKYMPK